MVKDDLIFKWQASESHLGFKIIAIIIVAVIFTGLFGIVDVQLEPPPNPVFESAAVLHFADEDLGRAWTLLAEEAGPFPGRLEITGSDGMPSMQGVDTSSGLSGWSKYEISLRKFRESSEAISGTLAEKGLRYFPQRVKIGVGKEETEKEEAALDSGRLTRKAILTPFDESALGWMPEIVPDFEIPTDGGELTSDSWRFVLRLRQNGSVMDTVSLGGLGEAGADELVAWLEKLRFMPGEGGERWLGLRVELINK